MTNFTQNVTKFNGRKFLFIMICFFAVIFAVNGFMWYLAIKNPAIFLAKNGYIASIDYAKHEKEHTNSKENK